MLVHCPLSVKMGLVFVSLFSFVMFSISVVVFVVVIIDVVVISDVIIDVVIVIVVVDYDGCDNHDACFFR